MFMTHYQYANFVIFHCKTVYNSKVSCNIEYENLLVSI